MGIGVYFLAGPIVVAIAGIGGEIGERIGGGPGYWAGCYFAALAASAVVGLLFARLFRGHSLYWAFGAAGLLLGGHLTWVALGGRAAAAPERGPDYALIACAALAGMAAGFALARGIIRGRVSERV